MNASRTAIRVVVLLLVASAVTAVWVIGIRSLTGRMSDAPAADLINVVVRSPMDDMVVLAVETARTPQEQGRGLMFRTDLEPGGGMLFLFAEERVRSFWMKNTLIPLDILFFDGDGRFVSRSRMEPCTADPCSQTVSRAPARYALEVNADEPLTAAVGSGWVLEL